MKLLSGISATRWVLGLVALLVLGVAFIDISLISPRVTVRWEEEVSAVERMALERRYRLESGQPTEGTTWRYELRDRSRDNVRAIVSDPAENDTGYIDRPTFEAPRWGIAAGADRARFLIGPTPSELIHPKAYCSSLPG